MENRKNHGIFAYEVAWGCFFVENLLKLRKISGKLPNRKAQRLPKGGQGRQRDEKNHWVFVRSTNFGGLGAALSILDTKKTMKSKLVGNLGSNTPLGRRI